MINKITIEDIAEILLKGNKDIEDNTQTIINSVHNEISSWPDTKIISAYIGGVNDNISKKRSEVLAFAVLAVEMKRRKIN